MESPDKFDNCHGGYNSAVEPAFNWRGSMMANAGRDPIFWATLAIAEPHVMASTIWGTAPTPACKASGTPPNLASQSSKKAITLSWDAGDPAPSGGYNVYYVQGGKLQLVASVPAGTLSYKDTGLTSRVEYTYAVTAWEDCDNNGTYTTDGDQESSPTDPILAIPR